MLRFEGCDLMLRTLALWLVLSWLGFAQAEDRLWSDASGKYQFDAALVAYSDTTVVLQKTGGELIAVPIEQLSAEDREYLKSKEAEGIQQKSADETHTWTLTGGLKLVGRVVDYAERDVTIQRSGGRIFVNDLRFDRLPAIYQEIVPRVVAHFEGQEIDGRSGLEAWLRPLRGVARTFHGEGVLMELEDGNRYAIPFFLFSDDDQRALKPGWERWRAAKDDAAQREEQSFLLRSHVQAVDENLSQMNEIALLKLQVKAFDAGLFDLWEVRLFPPNGSFGMPLSVVVPGRNSQQAASAALEMYPDFTVGPIARVRRRR